MPMTTAASKAANTACTAQTLSTDDSADTAIKRPADWRKFREGQGPDPATPPLSKKGDAKKPAAKKAAAKKPAATAKTPAAKKPAAPKAAAPKKPAPKKPAGRATAAKMTSASKGSTGGRKATTRRTGR